jgi:hypothetical protein
MANLTVNINETTTVTQRVNMAETKGRKLLMANLKTLFPNANKVFFSEGQFDKWDSAIEDNDGTRYFIEIKFRYMSSTKYSDFMIEQAKFDFLLKQTKRGIKSIYLNFFEDSKALIWNITDDSVYDNRTYTSNKVTENPNAGKVTRDRIMLLARDAKKYNVINETHPNFAKECNI